MLTHANITDSRLTYDQLRWLQCAAGRTPVALAQVSDEWVHSFRRLKRPVECDSAAMKIQVIRMCDAPQCVYMDADTLPLRQVRFPLQCNDTTPWVVHGFGNYNHIQNGIFAICRSPLSVRDEFVHATPIPKSEFCDMDLMNHMVGARKHLHRNTGINYRPSSNAKLARWTVVHWHGARKPWGADSVTRRHEHVLPALSDAWNHSYSILQRNCGGSLDLVP